MICIKIFAAFCFFVLPLIKDANANYIFQVPSLGCPRGFAGALIDGINGQRSDDGLRPLSLVHKGPMALEVQIWAATNRYLGNRRPGEQRYGQNFWYWYDGQNTQYFSRRIRDFLEKGTVIPKIWKDDDFIRYSRKEWAATTKVAVGCLTDWNSFKNGDAQVYVSLFYDYPGNNSEEGRRKTGDHDRQSSEATRRPSSRRPTRRPTTFNPRFPTTKRHGTFRTTLPTRQPYYPDFPTSQTRTRRPPHPNTPDPASTPQSCSQLLLNSASHPTSFPIPSSSCPAAFTKAIFCLLNQNRQKEGLPPLKTISKKLSSEAGSWTNTKRKYGELWTGERRFGQISYTIVDTNGRAVIPLKPEILVDQTAKFRPKIWSPKDEAFLAMEDATWAKSTKLGVGCTGFRNSTGSVLFVVFFFDNADFSQGYE